MKSGRRRRSTEATEKYNAGFFSELRCDPLCSLWFDRSPPIFSIDHSLDTIPQMHHVKIDQQTYTLSAKPQVRQQLGLVNRIDRANRLDFDNDGILDYHVDPISKIDSLSVIDDRQADLTGDPKFLFSKLMQKAGVISAFQKAGSEFRVNSHCGSNDSSSDLIDFRNKLVRDSSHKATYNISSKLPLCTSAPPVVIFPCWVPIWIQSQRTPRFQMLGSGL